MRDKKFNHLPLGWEIKQLEAVGESIIGLTYSPNEISADGLLVLRSSNIYSNKLKFDDNVFVKKAISQRLITQKNDILICVRNGSRKLIGKCALIRGTAIGETFGAFMSIFRSDYNSYLFHVLQSDFIKTQIDQHIGATINQITNSSINNFSFPFPPLPQQQKIAKILSTCDEVIEKTEAAIAKYQSIKQGMMHDLFTRGIDLKTGKLRPKQEDAPELYKESELGWIPKEWEVKRLEEFAILIDGDRGGNYPKESHLSDEGYCLFLSAKNVTKNGFDFTKKIFISANRNAKMNNGKLSLNDIVVTTRGTVGNVALYDDLIPYKHVRINSGMLILRIKSQEIINTYLYNFLNSNTFKIQLERILSGSAQPQITVKNINEICMPFPKNKAEQKVVITKISTALKKLKTEQSTLSKYQQLKSGLMQDLLTGKVEVSTDTVQEEVN